MRIYIDEAGLFVPPSTEPHSYSLVLALAIPSAVEAELFYEFLRIRDGWPNKGVEVKGSQLDESQAAEVIDLASRYDVLVNFSAIDMATHGDVVAGDFKLRQADALTANLTSAHHPNIVARFPKRRSDDAFNAQPIVPASLPYDPIGSGSHPGSDGLLRAEASRGARRNRMVHRPQGPHDHSDGGDLDNVYIADGRGPFL